MPFFDIQKSHLLRCHVDPQKQPTNQTSLGNTWILRDCLGIFSQDLPTFAPARPNVGIARRKLTFIVPESLVKQPAPGHFFDFLLDDGKGLL